MHNDEDSWTDFLPQQDDDDDDDGPVLQDYDVGGDSSLAILVTNSLDLTHQSSSGGR